MTEIMPVPRNLSFTVLPAEGLAAPVLTKLLLLTVILFSGSILSILSLAISQSY